MKVRKWLLFFIMVWGVLFPLSLIIDFRTFIALFAECPLPPSYYYFQNMIELLCVSLGFWFGYVCHDD